MIEKFVRNFKYLREDSELTQIELADALGVAKSAISYWETGTREPKMSSLIKIATYFKVTIDFLVGLEN